MPAPARRDELRPSAGDARTRLTEPETELDEDDEPRPSTAEQAVPWLIGFILLLAGMVIVLLALIFAGDQSFGAAAGSPSPTNAVAVAAPSAVSTASPSPPAPTATPTPRPSPSNDQSQAPPTPTPLAVPEYGPLEIVYQGRAAALAPIYLLRDDFTTEEGAETLAQDASIDVRRFAWSPDGRAGAGLLADVLVSIEPGTEKRRLGEGVTTLTFGADPATLYAVRVTQDGANDVANVIAIGFASGETRELAAISYARPGSGSRPALEEAQFSDDGGPVRLFWLDDGSLRLWVLGGGTWTVSPSDGAVTDLEEALPLLWDPGGRQRIEVSEEGGTSTLTLLDADGETVATTTAAGLVSHLRWSPDGARVVFTLGRSAPAGGVLQDLFLWDLGDGQAPAQLTNSGAAFGAEWLGAMTRWRG